jgi:hypothetical protein
MTGDGKVMVEQIKRDDADGFWIIVYVDRRLHDNLLFDTAEERDRAHEDVLAMMRSVGAQDMPSGRAQ